MFFFLVFVILPPSLIEFHRKFICYGLANTKKKSFCAGCYSGTALFCNFLPVIRNTAWFLLCRANTKLRRVISSRENLLMATPIAMPTILCSVKNVLTALRFKMSRGQKILPYTLNKLGHATFMQCIDIGVEFTMGF